MDFLLSLIFGLQIANTIHQKTVEESHQKRKRGRPKKNAHFLPAPVMRNIRQDQLTRLITSNIMDAERIKELLTELINLSQSINISSTTEIPDFQCAGTSRSQFCSCGRVLSVDDGMIRCACEASITNESSIIKEELDLD
ncbi:uncharacterized protein LOC122505081 [Leptopilina heterotoma]|uniref:uncharacterized protein LOC122505081 n=1 Tax=Leptopilina heterotoma TaxID=63436 RepID=UPI001CA87981|nr:uncharacterized protein LOC122505081 [Leptopilina heterotoma]